MKIINKTITRILSGVSLFALSLILLSACSESTLDVSSSDTDATLAPIATQSNGNVSSQVNGSGHFTWGGELRTFTFNAREHADGTVAGNWQFYNRAYDSKANGRITCMQEHDGITYIGGFMKKGDRSGEPNNEIGFRVVDNGEGNNSPTDQVSLMFVGGGNGFAQHYCNGNILAPALIDIEAGNIQD